MEELPGGITIGRLSFKTQHQSPTYTNERFENICWSRGHEHLTTKLKQSHSSTRYQCLEIPNGPAHTMEFLCRSWSPSASKFLQKICSSNQLPFHDNPGEHEEKLDETNVLGEHEETVNAEEMIGTLARNRITASRWINLRHMKGWLKEQPLTSFLRWCREKKKEEVRLQKAKIHAALSVAQLAAAIAGFAANNSSDRTAKNMTNGSMAVWDKNNSDVLAYAAALVATVCAEGAELVGAHKKHVASALNSGLAIENPADIIALTATAATCLRGAATLESRAIDSPCVSRNKEQPLKTSAKLLVVTPSGKKGYRWVSIYSMHKQPILSLQRKHLGVLTTKKEYTILHAMDEANEAEGYYMIGIKYKGGDIRLLFEDRKESLVWLSRIVNLLHTHNSC